GITTDTSSGSCPDRDHGSKSRALVRSPIGSAPWATSASLRSVRPGRVSSDEGRTFEGLDAIKLWHAEARKKYQHTVEPLDIAQRDSKTVVTGRVSGNFPSSPVSLEHVFELAGNKIASLEIR